MLRLAGLTGDWIESENDLISIRRVRPAYSSRSPRRGHAANAPSYPITQVWLFEFAGAAAAANGIGRLQVSVVLALLINAKAAHAMATRAKVEGSGAGVTPLVSVATMPVELL